MEIALIVVLAICLIVIVIREFQWRSKYFNLEKSMIKQIDEMKSEIERQKEEIERRLTRPEADELKKEAVKESLEAQRRSVKGIAWEQITPLCPQFFSKYNPADCRFIGKPIDFVVFQGLSEENPQKIIFVEVKTGETGRLEGIEPKIKKLVESIESQSDKVHWDKVWLETKTEEQKV